jgi:subtilisin-like proprotein convertase family protein
MIHRARARTLRRRGHAAAGYLARFESLELRRLLASSANLNLDAPHALALAATSIQPALRRFSTDGLVPQAGGSPVGLIPSQVRHAYGFDQIFFGSVMGDGSGQTIAIIDAYDDPQLVSRNSDPDVNNDPAFLASDLHQFDVQFGLPEPAGFFKKVNQNGGTTYPSTDPAGPSQNNGSWALEEALDVEWAHSMAPMANILLVEANSASDANLIQAAVNYARSQPGVVAVSMSFGGSEFSGPFGSETAYDTYFTTPGGHQGVTFLAATGDNGQPGGYPAYSPNVVAVGGTTLSIDGSNNYLSESGWNGSGGGLSTVEAAPSYQNGLVIHNGNSIVNANGARANPDIAMIAGTGVAVYDSWDYPSTGWSTFAWGGTSLATPCWAGLIAIADQGRGVLGQTPLDGPTQTLPFLYQMPASNFHDITGGNNGFAAGLGYDLVTGLGTPIAPAVADGLASVGSSVNGTITGTVFNDTNTDGVEDNGETGLSGWTVYDDLNNDGTFESSTQSTISSPNVPVTIPAKTTITSTLTISGMSGTIGDLNLNLSINDTRDSDLVITLIAPNSTQITLASQNGGSGDNFTNTTFDDQATTSVSSGIAPFTGSFIPIGSLAAANGISPNGVWTLQVADTSRHNSGTLVNWSVQVTTAGDASTTTGADGSYQLTNLTPGVHHLREVVQNGLVPTTPASGSQDVSVGMGATVSGVNFGNAAPAPPPPPMGDFDRDTQLSTGDLWALMDALRDLDAYETANSLNDAQLLAFGDLDGDGAVTNLEAQALIGLLAASPAPSSAPSSGSAATDPAPGASAAAVAITPADSLLADTAVAGAVSSGDGSRVAHDRDLHEDLRAAEATSTLIATSVLTDMHTDESTRVSRVSAATAPVAVALKATVADQILREGTLLRRRLASTAGSTKAELLDVFAPRGDWS